MLAINGYKTHSVFENTTKEHFTDYLFWFENIVIMSSDFNLPLSGLSYNLKSLYIDSIEFNQPINNLPETLEYLSLISLHFNQPVDNLPYNLKYLQIQSISFNQSLDRLPHSLEYLEIWHNSKFIFDLTNLPTNIKKIILETPSGGYFSKKPLINLSVLPDTLETLITTYKITSSFNLPEKLKEIIFTLKCWDTVPDQYKADLTVKYPSIHINWINQT